MNHHPHVQRTETGSIVTLTAFGEFDLSSVEILRTACGGALADGNRVVLDLTPTTFMDSTAIGVLVAAGRQAAQDQGWVCLVGPRPNVRKLLRITGVDKVLPMFDDVEQALAADTGQLTES